MQIWLVWQMSFLTPDHRCTRNDVDTWEVCCSYRLYKNAAAANEASCAPAGEKQAGQAARLADQPRSHCLQLSGSLSIHLQPVPNSSQCSLAALFGFVHPA